MSEYKKTLPRPTLDTKEYWEGCHRHELLVQQCKDCKTYRFYPCYICQKCHSKNYEWRRVSGKGKVYTWSVVTRAFDPAWKDDVPYVAAVVELDEQPGLLMTGNIIGCDPKSVKIGMPVEVSFIDVTDEITLPQWRPASI